MKSLLGMGNPLLDIMAEVDQATLDKYKVCCVTARTARRVKCGRPC